MAGKPISLHPEAVDEAEAALTWYRQRSPRAAARFLREIEVALEAIAKSPERWPAFGHETRRCLLRRFPFLIVYRELPNVIQVLAIAHGRRRPGYWKHRGH
jgi:plasmid stabilization system protein ParE